MALPIPVLDQRDFEQIVAEGRAMLPPLAPGWTDYNLSDPGITLMELLGARLEQTLYRLDRSPPALLRSYARRVGVAPLPAQVAEAVLLVAAQDAPLVLAAGTQVGGDGGAVFQTATALAVSPARLVKVLAGADVSAANQAGAAPWLVFGAAPQAGAALYLGFDRPLGAPGQPLRLYAWGAEPAADRALRARLLAEQVAAQAQAAHCASGCAPEPADWRLHYSARTVWEFYDGATWKALDGVVDETRACSLSGEIGFLAPTGHAAGGPDALLFFVRCRLLRGRYACPPRLSRIAHNAVPARHAADIAQPETLGPSAGHAGACFALGARPVAPDSCALALLSAAGSDSGWSAVADWDASGPHDRHYLLDAAAGSITGGNGLAGRVWPAGALLQISYQVGGGAAGNLAAGALARVLASPLNAARHQAANAGASPDWGKLAIEQPFPALGGADAETPGATVARAHAAAFAPERAVTCDDFARLARDVPGVPVARAHAVANYHPGLPCVDAAGCVGVIVVPACADPAAAPDADLLAAVRRHLDHRRTLATELHVVAPRYQVVAVSATLCGDGQVAAAVLQAAAAAALARFFDPVRGGPDGAGWPIGRAVYRAEVMAALAQVPGVVAVAGLGLAGEGDAAPRCGNLTLCPDGLVRSGAHQFRVAGPAPPHLIERSKPHDCP